MPEVNLAVPYKSQHDPDSSISNADCGAAALASVLEYYGRKTTVGEVLQQLGNPTGDINWQMLAQVCDAWGFNHTLKSNGSWNDIKSLLDQKIPPIVVGGYKYLTSVQDKNFKDSHIMTIVGYREDGGVYADDPDFWGSLEKDGDHHNYTAQEFFSFWRNEANKEGNQPNTLFVVTPKDVQLPQADTPAVTPPTTPTIMVTADIGVRVRKDPTTENGTAANIVRKLPLNTKVEYTEQVTGETVKGVNVWYRVSDGFIWSGAVQVITPLQAPNLKPSVPETPIPPVVSESQTAVINRLTLENAALKVQLNDAKTALEQLLGIGTQIAQKLQSPSALDTQTKASGYWDKLRSWFSIS